MKEYILDIADKLRNNEITIEESKNLLLKLFDNGFIYVRDQTPPINTELLVKSPKGILHLVSWRSTYNIFTCQSKSEKSYDWSWKLP